MIRGLYASKVTRNKISYSHGVCISMIVEERKTKAKMRLRSLVLLVKFLTILSVNKDTEDVFCFPASSIAVKHKHRSATEKKRGKMQ